MQKPNETIEYLLRELRGITLSDKAKPRMRAELSSYADFHAATAKEAAPTAPAGGAFAWFSVRGLRVSSAALLAVLLLAGGTTYAAESALPGNPLYSVKVNVAEPIGVALATTPQKKAKKHTELAERRLVEATKLAVNKNLDESTQAYLEQKFGEHVDSSLAAAEALEKEGKADVALDVRSHLEASLVAHGDILDLVEDHLRDVDEEDGSGRSSSRLSTRNLSRAVKLRQEIVRETRITLERDLADKATQSSTLALVTEASGAVPPDVNVALPPAVAEYVAESDLALADAKESLEYDDPEDMRRAFRKVREAGRASDIASTLMKHAGILMQLEKKKGLATTTPETATTTEPVIENRLPEAAR